MRISLGFDDYAYGVKRSPGYSHRSGRPLKQRGGGQGRTTGQVAQELEARYGIAQKFYDGEGGDAILSMIGDAVVEAMINVIEDAEAKIPGATFFRVGKPHTGNTGRPTTPQISQAQLSKIEAMFRESLTSGKYDGVIHGVPTKAATRASRPSLVETGLYRRSFKAEADD
jgi:hypothetical protein